MHPYLFIWLLACLPVCLCANHASFILSLSLAIGVCMWVSMGEMTTGFPTVLTTCSTPFFFPLFLYPMWHLYLDHHVVLSVLAFCIVLNYQKFRLFHPWCVGPHVGSLQVKMVVHEKKSYSEQIKCKVVYRIFLYKSMLLHSVENIFHSSDSTCVHFVNNIFCSNNLLAIT